MPARTITAVSRGGIVGSLIRPMVAREATDLDPITSRGLFAGWNPAGPISDLRKDSYPGSPHLQNIRFTRIRIYGISRNTPAQGKGRSYVVTVVGWDCGALY